MFPDPHSGWYDCAIADEATSAAKTAPIVIFFNIETSVIVAGGETHGALRGSVRNRGDALMLGAILWVLQGKSRGCVQCSECAQQLCALRRRYEITVPLSSSSACVTTVVLRESGGPSS